MKNINKLNIIFVVATLCISKICLSQRPVYIPDLSAVNDTTKWSNLDRDVRFDSTVVFNAKATEGAIWLKNYSFTNGKIDVDVKGKICRVKVLLGLLFILLMEIYLMLYISDLLIFSILKEIRIRFNIFLCPNIPGNN